MSNAFIYDAIRTPIGKYGGALATVRPDDLAALLIRAAVERNQLSADQIEDVMLGCANQAGEDTRNVARLASLVAGLPVEVPGVTFNRLCASGMQAVTSAMHAICANEGELFLAGGVDSMTRAPYVMLKPETTLSRTPPELVDSTIGWRFTNPRLSEAWTISFGQTAERIAARYGITRAEQDAYALQSHQKAVQAWETGVFADEVISVPTGANGRESGGAVKSVTQDEGLRKNLSLKALGRIKPAFDAHGTVTAGTSCGLSDGAALLVVGSEVLRKEHEPLARIVGSAVVGVDPALMGLGPIPAIRKLLRRTGVSRNDIGLVEMSEAFAVAAIACIRELELDPNTVNVNGGALALGYPLGASGARLLVTLAHQLRRQNVRYGLAAMCTSVGQGCAVLLERA